MSYKERYKLECEAEVALFRLIGPLAVMEKLVSYKGINEEVKDLLNIISNWGAKFQIVRNLDFISREELLNVYNRLDNINTNYLYNEKLGNENELADEIIIWMREIMELRKKMIEGDREDE